jgi:hypothetical protein|tara:strand:+ start:182 stop:2044 length:1863 start_codon:yes stop_codon:yes gene_type:complete
LTVAGGQTLNGFDTIEGGEGTDTLNATLLAGNQAPTLDSVENIFARAVGANTLNLANAEGVEQVWNDRSQSNLTVINVQNSVTLGVQNVAAVDNAGNPTAQYIVTYDTNALESETANQNIVLDGAQLAALTVNVAGNDEITTAAISVSGENEITTLTLGADLAELTLSGEGSLSVGNTQGANVINAAEVAGDVELDLAATANDTSAGAADRAVTLGAGDDVLDTSNLDLADIKVDGGEGDDTLIIRGSDANLTDSLVTNVSNFEALVLDGLTQTLGYQTLSGLGFGELTIRDSNAPAAALTGLTAESNVTLEDTNGSADGAVFTVTGADTDDNAEFGFATVGAEGNNDSTFNVTVNDVENLTVSTSDSDEVNFNTTTLSLTADALENLTVTGDQAVVFDGTEDDGGTPTAALLAPNLESVDVSGVTAASDRDNSEFAATVTVDDATVTGSAEADAIFFGAGADITGGAGDDALFSDNTNNTNQTFASITDFASGDTIVFGDTNQAVGTGDLVVDTAATLGAGSSALEEITVSVAPGQTASFGDYLEQAFGADNTTAGDLADGEVGFFVFDGNTYIVANNTGGDATAVYANPASGEAAVTGDLIQLTGSVDLSDFAYATLS